MIKKILITLATLLALFITFIFLRAFVIDFTVVYGSGMNPTLVEGDVILVEKVGNTYERGDIVVIRQSVNREYKLIVKRIIGLPGEEVRIDDGGIFVNDILLDEPYSVGAFEGDNSSVELGEEKYFLMPDNRENSDVSGIYGKTSESFFGVYIGTLSSGD